MNPELQIKAVAELDGWTKDDHMEDGFGGSGLTRLVTGWRDSRGTFFRKLPDYLYSRDAIIPVIEKCCDANQSIKVAFLNTLRSLVKLRASDFDMIVATPPQLSEALLRATGKWKKKRTGGITRSVVSA